MGIPGSRTKATDTWLLPVGDRAAPDAAVADPRDAVIVQLWCSRRFTDPDGEVFRVGHLTVRWFEPGVGPQLHRLLSDQTRRIWRALRAATRPAALEDQTGRKVNGKRIGAAAHELVERTGMPLGLGGIHRLSLSTKPMGRKTA